MRAVLTIVGCVGFLGLAGCVAQPPFNMEAVPSANVMLKAALEQCGSRLNTEFKTAKDFGLCIVAARAEYARAIGLKDQAPMLAYASRVQTAAEDFDRGAIKADVFFGRIVQINGDFADGLTAAYQINAREQAEGAARMMAFGKALQNAGAAMKASEPSLDSSPMQLQPPQPPQMTNCRTVFVGQVANTQCY